MTSVKVFKNQEDIMKIKVSGHAFYADYGNDIVCSAISMLCFTIANKLLDLEEKNIKVDISEGFFEIEVLEKSYENQILLSTLILGFEMIKKEYENTIKIKEVSHV